jgi:hypothetical protein
MPHLSGRKVLVSDNSESTSEQGRSAIKQFHLTKNRLAAFFRKQNYVNVDAVFLFGYGHDT